MPSGRRIPCRPSFRRLISRFTIPILSPLLIALPALTPADADAITRDDAITIVETTIIDTSIYELELDGYALQNPLPPGAILTQNLVDTVAVVADSAWFVWLDYKPSKKFAHDTEFILVNFQSGAIDLCFRGDLWPGVDATLHYLEDRATTPDLFWTDGASFPKNGKRPLPDIVPRDYLEGRIRGPIDPSLKATSTDVWGIIICPYDTTGEKFFRPDVECAKELFDSLGVPKDSIQVVYKKTRAQTIAALDAIRNDCDKLYVYWTGHGRPDSLLIPGGSAITARDFACKLKEQNAKEYCVIIDACFSGSILDDLADKGVNGFHSSSTSDTSWSTPMKGSPFLGSLYSTKLWGCLRGGARGIDAYEWGDSAVRHVVDSLQSSPDSTRWKRTWGGKYKNDDHAQGSYVHVFGSGGVGDAGVGEPFCFTLAQGCSTGCIRIPGNTNSDTCANFTLACQVVSGTDTTWKKIGGYNWNKGKTIYWQTFGATGATGKYKMTMHSNKGGTRAEVTWLPGTSTPVTTPNTTVFNAQVIGFSDDASFEFDGTLGSGVGGPYNFAWQDGADYTVVPANVGPGWYDLLQIDIPIDPDPGRTFLYNGGNPANGFVQNTMVIVDPALVYDPALPAQSQPLNWQLFAFHPFSGNTFGPFSGQILPPDPLLAYDAPPILVNLGTILPEPLSIDFDVFGPGAMQIDAIMIAPEEAVPCLSSFSTIHVAGDFNGFDIAGPPMQQIGPCLWRQELPVEAGCHYMKFVTDGNFDNPPDYGGCFPEDPTCSQPLNGQVCPVQGVGTALGQIDFPTTDIYEFVLDEAAGTFTITPTGATDVPIDDTPAVPARYALHGNAPNPFNPATTIRYDLPRASAVRVTVYDLSGRRVRVLEDDDAKPAGSHAVIWDGTNGGGDAVASGLYFYRIEAGAFVDTKRMVLIR